MLFKFLLSKKAAGQPVNEHFSRYVDLCKTCEIQYDFIGHVEAFHDDLDRMMQQFDLDAEKLVPAQATLNGQNFGSGLDRMLIRLGLKKEKLDNSTSILNQERNTPKHIQALLHEVPSEILIEIKKAYAIDAKMFGYNISAYDE